MKFLTVSLFAFLISQFTLAQESEYSPQPLKESGLSLHVGYPMKGYVTELELWHRLTRRVVVAVKASQSASVHRKSVNLYAAKLNERQESKMQLFGVRGRFFPDFNSFNFAAGVSSGTVKGHYFADFGDKIIKTNFRSDRLVMLEATVGNQFKIGDNLTLGCDWLGVNAVTTHSSRIDETDVSQRLDTFYAATNLGSTNERAMNLVNFSNTIVLTKFRIGYQF